MVNEIEDFNESSLDCSDISDFEEPVNTKNTDNPKKLISSSQDISKMPVNLRGPENCLKENRPHTSQTDVNKNVDDKVLSNTESVNNTVNKKCK